MIISTQISDAHADLIDAVRNLHPQTTKVLYLLAGRQEKYEGMRHGTPGRLAEAYGHYADILEEIFEDACPATHGELR